MISNFRDINAEPVVKVKSDLISGLSDPLLMRASRRTWGNIGSVTGIAARIEVTDISRPSEKKCREIFGRNYLEEFLRYEFGQNLVSVPKIMMSAAPHTSSLFNPTAPQTFCRLYKVGDPDDFCDPGKSDRWDQAQRDQQVMPAGVSREDYSDTWYNHFITLHGWGQSPEGIKYWTVENSWGAIYEINPSFGNKKETWTTFTSVADAVAGLGGLEITSREVYFASQ
jgi:hypothetical protein